jgi:type I restriction enzyme, S subunit
MTLVVPISEIFQNEVGLLARHENWKRISLGEICSVLNGFPLKAEYFNKERGFPVIRIRDLSTNKPETLYDFNDCPEEFRVSSGDLLIAMDGNFRCFEWSGVDAFLNQRVCKIIPNETVLNKKFLFWGINGYLQAIEISTSSVTVRHLSSRDILKIPFPLPPYQEQNRIVAKLEQILSKVADCQARLEKIPKLLVRFRQSVLAAACSGRLTADWRDQISLPKKERSTVVESAEIAFDKEAFPDIPSSWEFTSIEPILSKSRKGMKTGPFGSALKKEEHQISGIQVFGIENIGEMEFRRGSKIFITEQKAEELIEYEALPGDVLISRSGTVGEVCVVPEGIGEARISTNLMRIVLDNEVILPEFFCFLFNGSPFVLRQVEDMCKGSTRDFLNQTILKSMIFPLPPIVEQREIVNRVSGFFSYAEQLEARYRTAKANIDKLTQSILAKAFRGELVPQDPDDEPASVLLERIRAERDAQSPAPKQKRGPSAKKAKVSPPAEPKRPPKQVSLF